MCLLGSTKHLVYVFLRRWEKSFTYYRRDASRSFVKKFHGARNMSLSRACSVDKADAFRAYVNKEYMNNP